MHTDVARRASQLVALPAKFGSYTMLPRRLNVKQLFRLHDASVSSRLNDFLEPADASYV